MTKLSSLYFYFQIFVVAVIVVGGFFYVLRGNSSPSPTKTEGSRVASGPSHIEKKQPSSPPRAEAPQAPSTPPHESLVSNSDVIDSAKKDFQNAVRRRQQEAIERIGKNKH